MGKKPQNDGGMSLRTKDATSGGGTEGALATITEIGFVDEFTYGGRQKDKPQAALHVVLDVEGFDKPWDDNHTLGPSEKYEVVADGYGIKSLTKSTGLNKNCAAFLFMQHVEEAAAAADLDIDELVPELEDGGNSVQPLEGLRVRLKNVKFETVGGDSKDKVVIAEFLGDDEPATTKKGSKGKATSGSTKGKASKASSSDDIETATEEAVSALIEEHTSVKKGDLANLVYQADKKNADIKAMMNLCFKDSWVADEDRPWEFSKKTGKLAAKDND